MVHCYNFSFNTPSTFLTLYCFPHFTGCSFLVTFGSSPSFWLLKFKGAFCLLKLKIWRTLAFRPLFFSIYTYFLENLLPGHMTINTIFMLCRPWEENYLMWTLKENLSIEMAIDSLWLTGPTFKMQRFTEGTSYILCIKEEPQDELLVSHIRLCLFILPVSTTRVKFFILSLPCYHPIKRLWLSQPIRTVQNVPLFGLTPTNSNCTIWKSHLHKMDWNRNYG